MNIYVGNLSWQTTEEELQVLFSAHGQVTSVSIIKDRHTGASRGFGFVEMASDAEAHAAIEALNGTELGGRALKISVARPREEGDRDRRSGPPRRRERRDRNW